MTGFDEFRPGDSFLVTATNDKRLEVGSRGTVEQTDGQAEMSERPPRLEGGWAGQPWSASG